MSDPSAKSSLQTDTKHDFIKSESSLKDDRLLDEDYESALAKLDLLQSRLYRLRYNLPNLLKSLAKLDERESANSIFTKSIREAKLLDKEIQEFCSTYKECGPILSLATKYKQSSLEKQNDHPVIKQEFSAPPLAPPPPVASQISQPDTSSIQSKQSVNSSALATQKSIQSFMQSGLYSDQPIVLDDTSFLL